MNDLKYIPLICPECYQGKHWNCNGVGNVTDTDAELSCECVTGEHSSRPNAPAVEPELFTQTVYVVPPPENDPSILADAFPELVDDGYFNVRLKPNRKVIKDLLDVEVENDNGEWVPMVPAPMWYFLWLNRCLCGKYRLGTKRYQEHYAYAHILGMDDLYDEEED